MSDPEVDKGSRPIIFFKVGVVGSLPRGASRAIAEDFQAELFQKHQLFAQLRKEPTVTGKSNKIPLERVLSRLRGLALPALIDKRDVVADLYFNSVTSRFHTPLALVRHSGALAVALDVVTPLPAILHRVTKWAKEDPQLLDGSKAHPMVAARETLSHLARPQLSEGIDYIIEIDGSEKVSNIVEQLGAQLDHYGLLGTDVDPPPNN